MITELVATDQVDNTRDGNPTYRPLNDYEARLLDTRDPDQWRIETRYVGRVISKREMNGYDDSDFYAYVQKDDGTFAEIQYATTRGWTYLNTAGVDATPEVIDAYTVWRQELQDSLNATIVEFDKRVVQVGDDVKVEGGRKYDGRSGTVGWVGVDRYKTNRWSTRYRVGIDPDDGDRFFVPLDYVKVQVDGEWVQGEGPHSNPYRKNAGLLTLPPPPPKPTEAKA